MEEIPMKRLALVLAAALMGTGCIVMDDHLDACTGTVSLDWDFQRWDGSVPTGTVGQVCIAAGVAYVDVFMDGALVDRFNCSDGGVVVTGVSSGQYVFTVEGLDATAAILYRDEVGVDARRCVDPLVHARPSQGTVVVDYSLPGNACYGGPTYMSLQVWDDAAGQVAFFEPPTSGDACTTVAASKPEYVLPAGAFTLDWIHEMLDVGGGAYTVKRRDCTNRGFVVPPGGTGAVYPVLVGAVAACPESL
jgi:hypothetical protein